MYYCKECNIAHEQKNCPLCNANTEIQCLYEEINKLQSKLGELNA